MDVWPATVPRTGLSTEAHLKSAPGERWIAPPATVAAIARNASPWELCRDYDVVSRARRSLAARDFEPPEFQSDKPTEWAKIASFASCMGFELFTVADFENFILEHGVVFDNSCTFTMTRHSHWVPDHDGVRRDFLTSSVPGATIGMGRLRIQVLTDDGGFASLPDTRRDGSPVCCSVQPDSSFNVVDLKEIIACDGVEHDLLRVDPSTGNISNSLWLWGEKVAMAEFRGLTYLFACVPGELQPLTGACLVTSDAPPSSPDPDPVCTSGGGSGCSTALAGTTSTRNRTRAALGHNDNNIIVSRSRFHKIFLHGGRDNLDKLASILGVKLVDDLNFCDSCKMAKATRAHVGRHELGMRAPGYDAQDSAPCSFVVMDLLALAEPSICGAKSLLSWGCPVSGFTGAEGILGSKRNVSVAVDQALKRARSISGYIGVIVVVTDNEIVLKSKEYLTVLAANNAVCWHTVPYESRSNCFGERPLRSLQDCVRAVLFEGCIPPAFGLIEFKHCSTVLNDIPRKRLGWRTPRQVFAVGSPDPDVTFVRQPGIFGIAFDYPNFKKGFGSKLTPRGVPCVYLGVGEAIGQSGYLCLDIATNKIFATLGARFDETRLPFKEGLCAKLLSYSIAELNELVPIEDDGKGDSIGGLPRGISPEGFVGRSVVKDFYTDSEHGSVLSPFKGVVKGWRLEQGIAVFDVEYEDGDSEEVFFDSGFDGALGLNDILSDGVDDDRVSLATTLGFKHWGDVYGLPGDDAGDTHFYDDLIMLCAMGLNPVKSYIRLSCLVASSGSTPAAVRKRLAAYKRYGVGKLNESTYTSLKHACADGEEQAWIAALAVEWQKMVDRQVFSWTWARPGEFVAKLSTPCKLKGSVDLHGKDRSVRIVTQGCSERPPPGQDSFDSYAPVIATQDLLLFFNIVLSKGMYMMGQDLVGGYLHAPAPRERMLFHPPDFLVPPEPGMVLIANKSVYGSRDSGRSFYLWWAKIMKQLCFAPVDRNQCLWRRHDDIRGEIMVACIVDDSSVGYDMESTYEEFKRDLTRLGVSFDSAPISKFGGFNVDYDREKGVLKLTQTHLIEVGAKRFGINDSARIVRSPLDDRKIITRDDCPDPHASEEDVSTMRSTVGTLGFVASGTRPALRYAVSTLSRVADNPSKDHIKEAMRAMTYLYQTRFVPLVFVRGGWVGPGGEVYADCVPYSWADASLAASGYAELRRSFGGFVIFINGAVLSARCGLQKTTADSSAKSEVIEVYNCSRELIYVRSVFETIGLPLAGPIILNEDSSSAITILDMSGSSSQSRHFEVKWFWVNEMIDAGLVELKKCTTTLQLADSMTKPLPASRFHFLEFWLQGLHALTKEEVCTIGYSVPCEY